MFGIPFLFLLSSLSSLYLSPNFLSSFSLLPPFFIIFFFPLPFPLHFVLSPPPHFFSLSPSLSFLTLSSLPSPFSRFLSISPTPPLSYFPSLLSSLSSPRTIRLIRTKTMKAYTDTHPLVLAYMNTQNRFTNKYVRISIKKCKKEYVSETSISSVCVAAQSQLHIVNTTGWNYGTHSHRIY